MAVLVETGDQPQQRGLAGARGPQQGEELPWLDVDVDVDVLEDLVLAIGEPDVAALNADFLHGSVLRRALAG
ncbi:hypothetical protein D554_3033 [Bordetella holmesii 30539]|nr:hypothetical protein D560_3122 [Bordetella holmesii ATCC 51541]EWM49320.1 hypothetical protein D557_2398 [Bordetella holmesii 70147]EXF87762.1 hypothetical protein D554_3033 [Bordetella holmesii 30539]